MNVVLMAGGGGTRLWPLSRHNNPKQFFIFDGHTTLLEQTYRRAATIAEAQNIFVATLREYEKRVRELLPDVPADNFFFEPARRDTTAAFATIAIRLQLKGKGEEPTMFMWSDHVFTNEEEFMADLQTIPRLLKSQPTSVIVMGHVPTSPETTLGYIEAGERVVGFDDVYHVKRFKEKPDLATAKQYIAHGGYFWNIGSFSFRPSYLLTELTQYEPELMKQIFSIEEALKINQETRADELYKALPKIALEYTFIERTPRIIAVTGDYGWSDIGNWRAVQEVFGVKGDHMPQGHHVHVDSENNYVYNTTPNIVSLVGVKDMIVVVTADALLVTHKKEAHKVKEVVARLEAAGKTQHV